MARARPFPDVTLVADDLSAGSEPCLRRAALLLARGAPRLEVLHVLPQGHAAHRGPDASAAAQAVLQRRAEQLVPTGLGRRGRRALSATVSEGEPYVEIIRRGRLVEADLVVVGAHDHEDWRSALVGTTTDRVIRKGDVPVLIVKRAPRGPYMRAIAAIEPSDSAVRVLELAAALLPREGARLTVLSCFTVPFETEIAGGVRQVIARTRRDHHEQRRRACEQVLAAARGARRLSPAIEVVHGDPRTEVVRRIARDRADLLVVGTHGRSGIAHALLGSTAEELIRVAPCDVAVTRPMPFTFELP